MVTEATTDSTAPEPLSYRPKLDRLHRPEDPRQWTYRALVPLTVDHSTPRSLAKYFPVVDDQGAEGSCTANSGCLAQETCAAISGTPMPVPELSREELYYDERTDEGTFPQDLGAYTADCFDSVLRRKGLVLESVWAYDASPSEQPPAAVATAQRYLYFASHHPVAAGQYVDGILAGFDQLQPSVLGFNFYEEFFQQFQSTAVLSAKPTSALAGGHQITAKYWIPPCATLPSGGVGCQNSWGASSPARKDLHPDAIAGDIILPAELFSNGVVDEVRTVQPLSTPTPSPTPTPTPTPTKLTVSVQQTSPAVAGQPVSFVVSSTGAVSPVYAIIPGGGQPATTWQASGNFSIVYPKAGSYALNAYVIDTANPIQEPSAQLMVVVAAQPTPGPTPTPAGLTIASGALTTDGKGLKAVFTMSDGSVRLVP